MPDDRRGTKQTTRPKRHNATSSGSHTRKIFPPAQTNGRAAGMTEYILNLILQKEPAYNRPLLYHKFAQELPAYGARQSVSRTSNRQSAATEPELSSPASIIRHSSLTITRHQDTHHYRQIRPNSHKFQQPRGKFRKSGQYCLLLPMVSSGSNYFKEYQRPDRKVPIQ